MSNPITPTVVESLLVTSTGATAVVVGGAIGASTGTGTVAAGTVTDSVGTMATIRAGGIGIASQAAMDLITASTATQLARTAKGTAWQAPRINAGSTAWEFASNTFLIGSFSGTNATAAATTVGTVAISGLTALDTLEVIVKISGQTQTTALPILYSTTDSLKIADISPGQNTVAGTYQLGHFILATSRQTNTKLLYTNHGNDNGALTAEAGAINLTTPWTSAFTLGLRTGVGGVTAGGTFHFDFAVYKIPGQ